ncbi:hypothetical protein V8J88_24525 [Massilia sp. W12]|uniref:hypothetical protein n=1 Tax=Massilia sp. W12 TaxID=3126507 RepID=UPI0030CB8384
MRAWAWLLLLTCGVAQGAALDLRFSCSHSEGEGENRVIYSDVGEFKLDGDKLQALQWESALHRRTHGFDCSISQEDGVQAEEIEGGWRLRLADPAGARSARGYDTGRGRQCSIRLLRENDYLKIVPTCAVLCGSRANFSAISVHLPSRTCRYD